MRFAPLCREYGASLSGLGRIWWEDPGSAIDAFRRERSLLRPAVWFVDVGADRLADAAAMAGTTPVSATPVWQCLTTALVHLCQEGQQPIPVVPGITLLARRVFGLDDTPAGSATEDTLDEAALLLTALLRPMFETGSRSVAIVERADCIEARLIDAMLGPVHRLLAHQGVRPWLILEDGGVENVAGFGVDAAGVLLPSVDVRRRPSKLVGLDVLGYGLDRHVLAHGITPEQRDQIVAAARDAVAFSPIVSAEALPESVLGLADAVAMAPAE